MISNYPVLSRMAVIFLDTGVTILSYIAAVHVRKSLGFSGFVDWKFYINLLLLIVIVWGGLFEYHEAYAGRAYKTAYINSFKSLRREITIILRIVLIGCPIVYGIAFIIHSFSATPSYTPWIVPKSLFVIFAVINFIMLLAERIVFFKIMELISRKQGNIKKVLILGTGDIAQSLLNKIDNQTMNVIGVVGKETCDVGKEIFGYRILGCSNDLNKILHSYYIDELIIALPAKYLGDIESIVERCDKEGVPVRIFSPFFKNLISKSRAEVIYGIPNIMFIPADRNDLEMALKRLMDIIISLIALIVLSPFFLIIAVMIKKDSPGLVFYKWKILGLHKRPLTSYKFRTMVQDADELKQYLLEHNEMQGAAFKMRNDPRITRVGKWLRKYSLDELPQLFSVLKGDLSLVGPRPPLQSEVERYEGWHRRKLSVKPGLTCLWQISGRNTIADFDEWMKLDLKYIDEWTLWWDVKILFKTVIEMFKGSGL